MPEARTVMDRMTEAVTSGNLDSVASMYTDDATAWTPDQGDLKGRDQIVAYLKPFVEAFPDIQWEPLASYESGDTAIDEGFIVGTHTQPLPLPNGETLPATGRRIRVREVDIATVQNGKITSHRFYYDQMEFMTQLGLTEAPAQGS